MDEFGVSPTTGWQIGQRSARGARGVVRGACSLLAARSRADPFGQSATQAALLSAGVGFNGLYFARIDYYDLELRVNEVRCRGSLGARVRPR